jgi:hypothetical protein
LTLGERSTVTFLKSVRPVSPRSEEYTMPRPSAQEFFQSLLEGLEDLPSDFARRFADVLKRDGEDRSQAIRQLFEEIAGD